MIFALREPPILLGLVLGFLAGIWLRVTLQRWVGGVRRNRLRPVGGRRTRRLDWAAVFDPYGTVAAVIAGPGWGARPDAIRRRAGTDVLMLVVAVAAHGALAALGLLAFSHYGSPRALGVLPVSTVLHGSVGFAPWQAEATLGFAAVNVACGLLALVPIPPLELGVVLWGRLPKSPGARRLAYRLLEEQWGVAVVLLLLLLPLAGQQPLLLSLIDSVAKAIFGG